VARKHRRENAKRANRPNPREDRNKPYDERKNPNGYREEHSNRPKKKVELLPRSVAQEDYVDALEDPDCPIVFALGPAGTGKTLLATLHALKGLISGEYERIVITRPAVSVDEKHGFLPGDLNQKMEPWVMPIMDVFKEYLSPNRIEHMIKDGVIEIAPLAYMRGRTFKNVIVLGDEMQNSLPSQMKMLLTRIGEGSKLIINGDGAQHDRGFSDNGLADFVKRLERYDTDSIAVCRFDKTDVERHPVIEEVLSIYGDED
jgi:phosphate starvation-inducible protein PhoH and related proteins